ncbi:nei endonuclease VIII-like 1 [Planoprotostelium fungivorum]|uniref:DNA-(apurinic or apyrimidinic site) lyase n=1 Tax=Planoprotostelium fungivorum TaxID=1890364 RepID=A0A2P6NKX7_9EUKA|nr:nei endonuclease VIII-like 1 [Planoprotostelium fungivorum]
MPELAEVLHMSEDINRWCVDNTFHHIHLSESRNPRNPIIEPPPWPFTISSESYGKELRLLLRGSEEGQTMSIVMGMGMSGKWLWTTTGLDVPDSQLRFDTKDGHTLHFIDWRRFGRWKIGDFSKDRGPDPVIDFEPFCENIARSLHLRSFEKPICEVLLDQKYFNGIGNYLRAEILDRSGTEPLQPAKLALAPAVDLIRSGGPMMMQGRTNVITLCRDIPKEVIDMRLKEGSRDRFTSWLRCYGKGKSIVDGTGRRIWYNGELGGQLREKRTVVPKRTFCMFMLHMRCI